MATVKKMHVTYTCDVCQTENSEIVKSVKVRAGDVGVIYFTPMIERRGAGGVAGDVCVDCFQKYVQDVEVKLSTTKGFITDDE